MSLAHLPRDVPPWTETVKSTPRSKSAWQGALLVILSASCFGAMGLFGKLAYGDGVAPSSLLFMRFAIAAPILVALAFARNATWPSGRSAVVACAMGAIFVGNSLLYFLALTVTPAGTVAILFFVYPVFVTIGVRLLFREPLDRRKLAALALAIAGCVATIGPSQLGAIGGAGLALVAALVYSCYVMLTRLISSKADPIAQAGVISAVAACLFGSIVASQGLTLPHSLPGWIGVSALAIISTVVAITAFLAGAKRLGASGAATLSAAEPIVAALVASVFLGESLGAGLVLGLALIVTSTVLILTTHTGAVDEAGAPAASAHPSLASPLAAPSLLLCPHGVVLGEAARLHAADATEPAVIEANRPERLV